MKTRLAFSTISYNTPPFLETKLRELTISGVVSFWAFIVHNPEDDEAGKKFHCHIWVLPNRSVDTDSFFANMLEPDLTHPDKPFKCLSARSSKKFSDWYLYAIHDPAYLLSKGQSRRFHYSKDDIIASDYDDLNRFVFEIDMLEDSPYNRMIHAMQDGITFEDYFRRGGVPIPQIRQFEYAWQMVMRSKTYRNGRSGHEKKKAKKVYHARRYYKFKISKRCKR